MNRKSLGVVVLVLLGIGLLVAVRGPEDGSAAGFAYGCIRVGLVLGALWLALPQLLALAGKAPRWLLGWFVPGKPGGTPKPGQTTESAAPPIRTKRPRRRSQQ